MSTGNPAASVALSAPLNASGFTDVLAQLVALLGTHLAPGLAALTPFLAPLLALLGGHAAAGTVTLPLPARGRRRRHRLRQRRQRQQRSQEQRATDFFHGFILWRDDRRLAGGL